MVLDVRPLTRVLSRQTLFHPRIQIGADQLTSLRFSSRRGINWHVSRRSSDRLDCRSIRLVSHVQLHDSPQCPRRVCLVSCSSNTSDGEDFVQLAARSNRFLDKLVVFVFVAFFRSTLLALVLINI